MASCKADETEDSRVHNQLDHDLLNQAHSCNKIWYVSLSNLASFNKSVVQGSGIGLFLFIIYILDLRAHDLFNYLLKYADDTTLINPELAKTSVEEEMNHIIEWAKSNKMSINLSKTKEMIFHRPNPRSPSEVTDIKRVYSIFY